ncbi:mannonate dehydratase [Paenibacillus hamazuiensis]|uniref:mannonate dehydratase n=1 Tax=Paenibacillus hamazuiensis TaxID=2936508 RepID=UPI00200CBD6C|nr:mannonate dehydratase [Paenibacillus hamazuiensis]
MMKISVTSISCDLTDTDLKQMSQLGVDCIDFGIGSSFPGVKEQGYPDLDRVLKLKKKVRSWGLDINRVTLPDLTDTFIRDLPGAEKELENARNAVKVFGEAGIPIVRQRFAGDVDPVLTTGYPAYHRGGAIARGESLGLTSNKPAYPTFEEKERWWARFNEAFKALLPIAEDYNVKLTIHPSDTPNHETAFNGLGMHRVIDTFPSKNVGFVYCIGTRAEEGGSSLVLDEINHYGRKGRIFLVHFRNVRGSLATAGAFEEAMLDDGDLNMFKLLLELHKVGYDGCLNPDHYLQMEGDTVQLDDKWKHSAIGWASSGICCAYSIGYIRAMLTALAEFTGRRW